MAAAATLAFSSTFALADTAQDAAQRCALHTRAPGNYNISTGPGVPHVIPGQGGTAAGASRVNDCLLDAYAVQFGGKRGSVVSAAAAPANPEAAVVECKRIRNRRIGSSVAAAVGFTLGVGDPYTAAAAGGAIGVGITARRENRRFGECVAAATAAPIDTNAAVYTGCSRRGGVMSNGTSLCVSP